MSKNKTDLKMPRILDDDLYDLVSREINQNIDDFFKEEERKEKKRKAKNGKSNKN